MKGTPYAPWASRSGTDENSESKCVFWHPFSTPMTLRLNYHEAWGANVVVALCVGQIQCSGDSAGDTQQPDETYCMAACLGAT